MRVFPAVAKGAGKANPKRLTQTDFCEISGPFHDGKAFLFARKIFPWLLRLAMVAVALTRKTRKQRCNRKGKKRMPRTRASLWIIACTLLTSVVIFMLPYTPRLAVHTETVRSGSLVRSMWLDGVVAYHQQQALTSPQAGRIGHVYVRQGESVKAGELLISLDADAEEAALASLMNLRYRREQALEGAAADALAASLTLEAVAQEEELRHAIALKQIRAEADGVVGSLYVSEGDYVAAFSALGLLRTEEKCIAALGRTSDLTAVRPGMAAVLETREGTQTVYVSAVGQPSLNETTGQSMQQVTLLPLDETALENAQAGESATVRLFLDAVEAEALVPVSAVGAGDRIWLVRDGCASSVQVDVKWRNDEYVAVDAALLEERVILNPDALSLYEGCPVKEARR